MKLNVDPELMVEQRAIANTWDPNRLLQLFAPSNSRPKSNDDVDTEEWPLPKGISFKEEGTKGLGTMTPLPIELMLTIIKILDLPSAISFSSTCRTANIIVHESPVSFIKQWAPELGKYLRRSYIHRLWTIDKLKAAIRSGNCVSCGESCNRLFLATMERVCQPCMQYNHAYWCLPVRHAALIFGLRARDVPTIGPIYVSSLSVNNIGPRDQSAWVIPIKCVLARSLELYGTRNDIKRVVEGHSLTSQDKEATSDLPSEEFKILNNFDIYRSASLERPTPAELRMPMVIKHPHVHVHSSGISIRTPVVPYGNTQKILRACRGCAALMTHPNLSDLSDRQLEMMRLDTELNEFERGVVLFRRAFRVWSFPEMLDHMQNECLGGWFLVYAAEHEGN